MNLSLRNDKNNDIVDIEINFGKDDQDLHSSISIKHYSKLLLDNLDRSKEVIKDFDEINELRGWFWEVYMEFEKNPSRTDCVNKVKSFLMKLADKYKLFCVAD